MASGGERGASVSGDGNHSGRASGGGSSAPACFESAARATGSAHPGLCRSHGNGAARWPCLFMPPEAISMPATLYLYAQRVRIVAGRYEAEHPRKFAAQESSSLPEHRAAMVAAVSGKRGKRYLKRQQLLELGEPAIRYLTEIVHRRPRQWFEDVDRLHQILQSHGPEVLRRAMEEGLKQQIFGAFYVERSLQAGLSFSPVVQ